MPNQAISHAAGLTADQIDRISAAFYEVGEIHQVRVQR